MNDVLSMLNSLGTRNLWMAWTDARKQDVKLARRQKEGAMLKMPDQVYAKVDAVVVFRQLGVKVQMDTVGLEDYYEWLDRTASTIGLRVGGARVVEKTDARVSPPLNTAIYYDTPDYRILPTGALIRTSCNAITHAFCAFKDAENDQGVREDHRYVFQGDEKQLIQLAPSSEAAVAIVMRLLTRSDIVHPGTYLERSLGIRAWDLTPAISLEDLRYTFFVWLDGRDALRCSLDRYAVSNLRLPEGERPMGPLAEAEISIYPRIDSTTARDPRVVELITALQEDLCREFGVSVTKEIKYQRSARALGISSPLRPNRT